MGENDTVFEPILEHFTERSVPKVCGKLLEHSLN